MLRLLLLLAFLSCTTTQVTFAAFEITFSPSSPNPLVAGSAGTVDVLIRSTTGTDSLDAFNANVVITGGPGLVFSGIQTEAQLTNPNYVFFGNSLNVTNNSSVGTVTVEARRTQVAT